MVIKRFGGFLVAAAPAMVMGCADQPAPPAMAVTALLVPNPSETASTVGADAEVMVSIRIQWAEGEFRSTPRVFTRVGSPATITMQSESASVAIQVDAQREQGRVVVHTTATLGDGHVLRDRSEARAPLPGEVARPAR